MKEHSYLKWMAEQTDTDWCNDSAIASEIDSALLSGAIGCTTNPPLTFQVLTELPELFQVGLNKIPKGVTGNEKVVNLIEVVVRSISAKLLPIYERSGKTRGYVRAQVAPPLSADADAMLAMGKTFSSWAPNIKVKIPGTAAGMKVLEELTSLGIPTNPTICVSLPQMVAAAEAHERGIGRARAAGIDAPHSTSAYVLGRLQDYLAVLNTERSIGLSTYDLECAVLAVAKRCYALFQERGFSQEIMPAAFRCAKQVTELAGSKTVMTIHPSVQDMVIAAEESGEVSRVCAIDGQVDPDAVDRVLNALPEFRMAYEPDGIPAEGFDTFGATAMTLNGFNETGWRKLLAFALPA